MQGPEATARLALARCPELVSVGLFLWSNRGVLRLGAVREFTLTLEELETALLHPDRSELLAQVRARMHALLVPFPGWLAGLGWLADD